MKNIFLFGAGASYGSGGLNYLAPLGYQLFYELEKLFPNTWGKLPDVIKERLYRNFEDGMDLIWIDNSLNSKINVLMQQMAVFFSKIRIVNRDENLYVKLVRTLKDNQRLSDYICSTINYDCLLELAASALNLHCSYSSDAKELQSLLICKLHGSCNFILDPESIKLKRSAGYRPGAFLNGSGLKSINRLEDVEGYCYGDNALYPAMSIYMRSKPNQIGKPFIESMQNKWAEWVKEADKIFIIGVNPNSDDTHIWAPLSETPGKVYFCGNSENFYNWQKSKNRTDTYLGKRFEDVINKIISEL